MPKLITFDKMKNIKLIFELNINTNKISLTGDYYPAQLSLEGEAFSNGISYKLNDGIFLGPAREIKYTPQELYSFIRIKMGQEIADKIKDLYLAGINEDIST